MQSTIDYYRVSADQGRIFRKIVESFACATAFLLGMSLIGNGFSNIEGIYFPLSIVANANLWGALFVILAAVRATVLIVNGYWPHSHVVRKWLSVAFIFGLWGPLVACYWWYFFWLLSLGTLRISPGQGYSLFVIGIEFFIFYAHSTFVYVVKRGRNG